VLILTRRMGESVCIGDQVTVTVLAVKGAQVRLGINAPREVTVDRQEVHERKLAQGRSRPRSDSLSESPLEPLGAAGLAEP
jgi:carbon storage regulator